MMDKKNIIGTIIGLSLIIGFFFYNKESSDTERKINGESIVGKWYYKDSQIMGGYEISQSVELTITRNGPGDGSNYEYKFKETFVDQMYGGIPHTEFGNGGFEPIKDNIWKFSGGDYDYGERGGHIVIPSNDWNGEKPKTLTIRFKPGRGKEMIFIR